MHVSKSPMVNFLDMLRLSVSSTSPSKIIFASCRGFSMAFRWVHVHARFAASPDRQGIFLRAICPRPSAGHFFRKQQPEEGKRHSNWGTKNVINALPFADNKIPSCEVVHPQPPTPPNSIWPLMQQLVSNPWRFASLIFRNLSGAIYF